MNDTDAKMNAKMMEMIQKKTSQERLAMGCSMFDFAKRLVVSSLLKDNPNLSPAMLRKELFLRFYGNDFDAKQRQKIIEYLTRPGWKRPISKIKMKGPSLSEAVVAMREEDRRK